MKAKVSALISVLLLVCVLLMSPAPVQATASEPLRITFDLRATQEGLAEGSFGASGLFTDSGSAYEVFFVADGTVHGVKTLVGSAGAITIRFQARLTPTGEYTSEANGRFVIISGTDAYKNLRGQGTTHADLDMGMMPPAITGYYSGAAHFDAAR